MTKEQQVILSLIRLAVSKDCVIEGAVFDGVTWADVIEMATVQGVLGVCFAAIEMLSPEQRPDMDNLMEWFGQVEYMRTQVEELDVACNRVTRNFKAAGFDCVILKGQGIARDYPDGLLRTPGDIDCWVFAPKEMTCRYLRDNVPGYKGDHEGELHTEFKYKDITVEVHFTATILRTPRYSMRLHQWLDKEQEGLVQRSRESTDSFPLPTLEFNIVYLMLHMYRHYLFEGIGLRHVVDYIIVLQKTTSKQREEAYETLKWLGAGGFTAAMMWVIFECIGFKDEGLRLCPVDSWRGRKLWKAILDGGNFGKADKMNSDAYRQWGVKRLYRFVVRNTSLFIAYPSEIGWHIVKRIFGKK